jgi:cytosine deaminase
VTFDLTLRSCRIDDGKPLADIGIKNGTIAAIGSNLDGGRVVDVNGDVVVPTFIESHIHPDKALLDRVKPNLEGTLSGALRITGELKRTFVQEEVMARARQVLNMLIAHGTTIVRAHPDTDPLAGLTGFKSMLELKREYDGLIDFQLVAFPQEGLLKSPGAKEILEEALELGADVVGGCPYNENSFAESKQHVDWVFSLAKKYNRDVDLHADFGDDLRDLRCRCVDYIVEKTIAEGYQGRVTLGHMISLASVEPEVLDTTIGKLREARINIVPLPATDLFMGGRADKFKVRRAVLNPAPFVKGGVNIAFSSNNIRNAFTPFGKGDLVLIGSLYEHVAQLGSVTDQRMLLDMITNNAAKVLRIEDSYGLQPGKNADLVVLGTKAVSDVFLDIPVRKYVIKRGKIIYRSELIEMRNF